MPRKKTAEDSGTPAPTKTTRKKKAAPEVETVQLEPDEADLQDDELTNAATVGRGALTNTALAAGEDEFDEDDLDDASGVEIQLGVLTGQIEELTRVMATLAEKLDRIEAVVRSNANRSAPSRDDRPRTDASRDDRPRTDASRERPARRDFQSRDDRPKRDFQPRGDRPNRDSGERPRSFAPRSDSRGPSDRGGSSAGGDRPRSFAPRGDSRGPSDRGGERPRSFAPRSDSRGPSDRGPARSDSRGNDSRGNDSRGFSKGFDRGSDSRGPVRSDSRGNDSRGSAPARSFPPRPERTDRPKTESSTSSEPRGFGRRKDHGFGGVEVKRREED